jgi:hypothetical protein
MSSPQMTRMLGFCCCATAGALINVAAASSVSETSQAFLRKFIVSLHVGCSKRPYTLPYAQSYLQLDTRVSKFDGKPKISPATTQTRSPQHHARVIKDAAGQLQCSSQAPSNVCFGSKADKPSRAKIHRCPLLSESGQTRVRSDCPLCANTGLMHCSKRHLYSITSSARESRVGGTVRPSALAVLRLMTSSNLVGCSTGRSPGLAPLKILSIKLADRR